MLSAMLVLGPAPRTEALFVQPMLNLAHKDSTLGLFEAKVDAQQALTVDHGMALGSVDIFRIEPSIHAALLSSPATVPPVDSRLQLFTRTLDSLSDMAEPGMPDFRPTAAMDRSYSIIGPATLSAVDGRKFTETLPSRDFAAGSTVPPSLAAGKFALAPLSPADVHSAEAGTNTAALRLSNPSFDKADGPFGADLVIYAAPSSVEGGWVSFGGEPTELFRHRVGQVVMVIEHSMAIDLPTSSGGPGFVTGTLSTQRVWPGPSGATDPKLKPGNSTRELPQIPGESVSPSEGGFVTVPSYGAGEARSWITSWAAPVRVTQDPRVAQAYGDSGTLRTGSTLEAAQDAVFSNFNSGIAPTRHSTSEGATDGGFVEIGSVSKGLSRWSGRAQSNLTGEPTSSFAKRDAIDGLLRTLGDRDDFWDGPRIALDDDLLNSEPAVKGDGSAGSAQDFAQAFASDEGGMINLVAAYPAADPSQGSIDLPRSAAEPVLGARGIRMDKGVGQFKAFDLAAVPLERVDGSGLASIETAEDSPWAAASASSAVDARTAESSSSAANESEEQPLHATAAIPAIAVASLLAPRGRVLSRRTVAMAAHLLRWLTRKAQDDRA